MSKSIRDGVTDLGTDLCRAADRHTESAKQHAFEGLDGDADMILKAKENRGAAQALMFAVKQVDAFRTRIERGDYSK